MSGDAIGVVLAGPVAWTGKRPQLDRTGKRPDHRSSPLQLLAVAVAVASDQGGPKDQLRPVATGLFRVVQHGYQNVHFIDFSRFLIFL